MKKENIIVGIISIIVLIGAIFTAIVIRNEKKVNEAKEKENIIISGEEIEDECTEEYKKNMNELAKQASSAEEKVSANAMLILKKYYRQCEHTINEYVEMPAELVNMTEKEVQNEYPEWELIGFSANEVILYKEFDERCKEHFILKVENGKIVVYKMLETGELELYDKTEIGTEYLTETDLINMQDGLEIYGKEQLNKILEDFE
ncbi:MAG: hypothetical protein HFJ48_07045 [Clostridia bacterium]|nr:hypothetical protein [Clostridia bacterium]